MICLLSRLVILIFGTLYPAYSSYKTVRSKDVKGYVQWMKYWIVFAFLSSVEPFCDLLFSPWMPFYYETKILLVAWLICPATRGYNYLYRTFIHRALREHEEQIDDLLENFKEKWHGAIIHIGKRGSAVMLDTVARVVERRLFDLLQWTMFARMGYAYPPYPEEVPSTPPSGMISFSDAAENRAIQYEPEMMRSMVVARNRRQSDPTHISGHLQDAFQNRRYARLKRSSGLTSLEPVRFINEDLPFFTSNTDLTSSTDTLQAYPDSSAFRSLEELNNRVPNLAPTVNERLSFLVRKLSLGGLNDRDINTVVATLLSGMESQSSTFSKEDEAAKECWQPNPHVSSKTETTKEPSSVGLSTLWAGKERSMEADSDLFSDASDGEPSKDECFHPSHQDGCPNKDGTEAHKSTASKDAPKVVRAGRYGKRPAPCPPDQKKAEPLEHHGVV